MGYIHVELEPALKMIVDADQRGNIVHDYAIANQGLGLVKQMCTDMGIRLMIESEEGKGTTFRLQIPLSTL